MRRACRAASSRRGLLSLPQLSIALWLVVEQALQRPIHPQFAEMLMAARTMQAASRVLLAGEGDARA